MKLEIDFEAPFGEELTKIVNAVAVQSGIRGPLHLQGRVLLSIPDGVEAGEGTLEGVLTPTQVGQDPEHDVPVLGTTDREDDVPTEDEEESR